MQVFFAGSFWSTSCIDLIAGCVNQDAREVQTKFSKSFSTYLFPVGEEIHNIVAEWVSYLRDEKLRDNVDTLFPSTRTAFGASQQFEAVGLNRTH